MISSQLSSNNILNSTSQAGIVSTLANNPLNTSVIDNSNLRSSFIPSQIFDLPQLLTKPDLIVSVSAPDASIPGVNLSPIQVTVRNIGDSVAAGTKSAGSNGYMVDVFLSSEKNAPKGFAIYSPSYSEDVLFRGGRISNTPDLKPGEEFTFTLDAGLPVNIPVGKYFLGATVDAGRLLAELDETNNTDFSQIAIKLDTAGNTQNEARRINISSQGRVYSEQIGGTDPVDFFSFSLGAKNEFALSLDGLSANADLELQDINGKVVLSSKNQGIVAESIKGVLEAGAYRIKVSSADGINTAYNMNASIKPLLKGITTSGSDKLNELFDAESKPLINMDDFRQPVRLGGNPRFEGVNGSGLSTVIIDTGINLNHPFFGPDRNRDGISDRIVYSFDFAGDDPDADDTHGHGTNVASIAVGFGIEPSGRIYEGMATGANIVALKVFPNGTGRVGALDGDIEQALHWVIANAATFNIASVNLSLGSGNVNTITTSELSDEFQILANLGVIVVTAAGNRFFESGSRQGVNIYSADSNTLSVGAVWDGDNGRHAFRSGAIDNTTAADRITSFSQRHSTLLDIFAPGAMITGAGLGDATASDNFLSTMAGTSQAAPHVAGIALLTQQLAQRELGRRLTPTEFRDIIRDTGVTINDGDDEDDNVVNTGLNFKRIDMMGIANEILRRSPIDAATQPVVTLMLPNIVQFRPRHTGGDKDFDGNGPRITITTNIGAISDGRTLQASVFSLFQETKSDWTTFTGTTTSSVDIEELYPGWRIDTILSSTFDHPLPFVDTDHDLDIVLGNSLVQNYEIQGDKDGGIFGGDDDPFVSILFNPVQVRLRRA